MDRVIKIFYLLCSILYLCIGTASYSKIRTVRHEYKTIQAAINASKIGDTVLVDHGIYFENIHINKNIVLASRFIVDQDTSHISTTIIDGSKPHDSLKASVIYISGKTDSNCIILGFTIRRGLGTYVHAPIEEGLNPSVMGYGEYWIGGGGIFVNNAGARIAYNVITENKLTTRINNNFTYGAGIAGYDTTYGKHLPAAIVIEHNTVCNNISSGTYAEGAGINVWQPGIIQHNTIIGNRTFSSSRSIGGGVVMGIAGDYDLVADGNYICNNVAGIGGGMLISSGTFRRGRGIVTNNIIANNKAFEVGGAANIAEGAYALLVNNTIVGNKAMASGGGLNVTVGSHATVVNNIIWGNETEQISMWGDVQAITNDIEGGFPGKNNIHDDPKFLFDDSLFQLLPNSPCLGTGSDSIHIFQQQFPIPDYDFAGHVRPFPFGTSRDIGARESSFELPSISTDILLERISSLNSRVKLTMIIEQTALGERDAVTSEITRAGKMNAKLIVNDSLQSVIHNNNPMPQFTLPPGDNLIELEIIGKGVSKPKGINVYFWLEGFDPHVSILRKNIGKAYNYYANLKPGKYKLIFQPQDQERIIGHTNRVAVEIIVPSYWYQRWWVYALYGMGIIACAFIIYRIRLKRLRLEQNLFLKHMEAKKLADIDKLKSNFFANISHEFRTPLTLIQGPAEQIASGDKKENPQELARVIVRNSKRLLQLVNQLLDLSKIESGQYTLNISQVNIVEVVKEIAASFESLADRKGIEYSIQSTRDSIDGWFDRDAVEKIVTNMISNAFKFTATGGEVKVGIGLNRTSSGEVVEITISDSGIGIPASQIDKIFDRFYQVETTHTREQEGSGIGLALTRDLVEVHKGTITVQSKEGEGSTFIVQLPIGKKEDYSGANIETSHEKDFEKSVLPEIHQGIESAVFEAAEEDDQRPLVLIVEDNTDMRHHIRTRIGDDYRILEAVNGTEGVTKAIETIPDLVISDVMMPKMDGYQLCRILKQDEKTSHIPIILLTAKAGSESKIEGLETGADDYLEKPFDAKELNVRIQNLIKNRKKVRETFRGSSVFPQLTPASSSVDQQFINKAIATVHKHLSDDSYDTDQFSKEMFLSRSQLHRKLKALTDLSATEFIRKTRLHYAKELLEKNTGTIAEIADRVGFSNHSYFAKCFKEQFGHLPSERG